jgi:uncharacterized protein with NRDE domain
MKKLALILLVALTALALVPARPSSAQAKVVRITLIDENGSGEDGSAQLTDQGDGTTKVELLMLNAPEGAVQPAHIHKGSCATLNPAPAYPLNDVVEGKSTTVVKVTLAELTSEKYAINVHKSAAEAAIYVSCGNLPTGTTTSSGPLTLAQAFAALLDQAQELEATVKKHEFDASQAAYDLYHGTFAANEDAIKAKDAATWQKLEDDMHGVRDAVAAGDWPKAEAAAETLVQTVKAGQSMMGGAAGTGSTASSPLMTAMNQLAAATGDLVRETTNKDTDGAQRAYDAFHTLFATNENDLKAKNAEAQAHIEAAMHEVRDALAAGDWPKAQAAATELQNEVNDAIRELGALTNTLPTSGNGSLPLAAWLLAGAALGLLALGATLRRRAVR